MFPTHKRASGFSPSRGVARNSFPPFPSWNTAPSIMNLFLRLTVLILLSGGLLPAQEPPPGKEARPNFVIILADDLAWDDLGALGNKKDRTPNLDRLASEGMCFDQAFLTISSCSPSRASILTGRYPHQTDAEQLHWPLPESQVIFPQRLKKAGYFVGAAGKWHLGDAMRDRFTVVREVDTSGFQLPPNAGAVAEEEEAPEAREGPAEERVEVCTSGSESCFASL